MKNVLKLGKTLSKAEQKQISGGSGFIDPDYCAISCNTGVVFYQESCDAAQWLCSTEQGLDRCTCPN